MHITVEVVEPFMGLWVATGVRSYRNPITVGSYDVMLVVQNGERR